jgi:5'-methylthioadenosine phosphorylase
MCAHLSEVLHQAALAAKATAHRGGTYICIEGPQFSTRAESRIYRSWGVDVIGMTNVPEAKLAREAGLCYATLALITDYDCWHETEAAVSVDAVVKQLQANSALARQIVRSAATRIPAERPCRCAEAARYAVITHPEAADPQALKRLALILGRSEP